MEPSALATTMKPGNAAITAPKPYSDAVFMAASTAPLMAARVPSANWATTGRQASASTDRMPTSSAPTTAQIAPIFATSCTTGAALPMIEGMKLCSPPPYQCGMPRVNSLLETNTSTSGSTAMPACARCVPVKGVGSFTRVAGSP